MEWTCTDCGSSAVADDERLLRTMGWRFAPPADAICPPCARKGYRRPQAYHSLTMPEPLPRARRALAK